MMYHDCSGSVTFVIHRASLRCVVGPGRTQAPHSSSQLANASMLLQNPLSHAVHASMLCLSL